MQVFNATPLDDNCSIDIKCSLNIGRLLVGAFDAVHECGELCCYLGVYHQTLVVDCSFFSKLIITVYTKLAAIILLGNVQRPSEKIVFDQTNVTARFLYINLVS